MIKPKIAVRTRFVSRPFAFIVISIAAIATAINIQKSNMVGASKKPMFFFLINAIPVTIKAGRQIAISNTCTGLINNPLSIILLGVAFISMAGIISESQMK